MDTENLSNETYKAVIIAAERFNHDLTLQFGCLASRCVDDDDYLLQAEELINDWLEFEDFDELMIDIFFGNPPSSKSIKKTLSKILLNINQVRQIPIKERTFEFL